MAVACGDSVKRSAIWTHAEVLVDVPTEDLPDDLRLGLGHLDVGRDCVTSWNPPVAVGDLPPKHLALSRAIEFASAVPFRDLDALVLGDRTLDLSEQARLWIIGQGLIEKNNLDAEALELFENQNLIGVLAREAIRAQDQHRLERPASAPSRSRSRPGRSSRAPLYPSSTQT